MTGHYFIASLHWPALQNVRIIIICFGNVITLRLVELLPIKYMVMGVYPLRLLNFLVGGRGVFTWLHFQSAILPCHS